MGVIVSSSEWVIPALLLFVIAWSKFYTLPNRGGTTFVLFFFGVIFYYALILALWLLVSISGIGFSRFVPLADTESQEQIAQYAPIFAALIILVSPHIFPELLNRIDTAARTFCLNLAGVPREADRLSVELAQIADFEPPTGQLRRQVTKFVSENIGSEALNFSRDGTLSARFTRAVALHWLFIRPKDDGTPLEFSTSAYSRSAYFTIMNFHEAVVNRANARYEEMMRDSLTYFTSAKPTKELEETFSKTITELSNVICSLIARYVLYCDVTRRGRRQRLSSMGFDVTNPVPTFGLDQWAATILAVLILSILMMVLLPGTNHLGASKILTIAITFALSIGFAVMAAVVAAERFIERREREKPAFPPVADLLIAALVAVGLTMAIKIAFPLVPALIEGNSATAALQDIVSQFQERSPELITPFMCTISLGLLCSYVDLWKGSSLRAGVIGAIGNGLAFLVAGFLVGTLLNDSVLAQLFRVDLDQARHIIIPANTGITGAVVGLMVLTAFGKSEHARKHDPAHVRLASLLGAAVSNFARLRFWAVAPTIGAVALVFGPLVASLTLKSELQRGSRSLIDPALNGAPRAHATDPTSISFTLSNNSHQWVVTSSYDGTIKFWDLYSGRLIRTTHVAPLKDTTTFPGILSFSVGADGKIRAYTQDGPAVDDGKGNLSVGVSAIARRVTQALLVDDTQAPGSSAPLGDDAIADAVGSYTIARNWFNVAGAAPFAELTIPGTTNGLAVALRDGRVSIEAARGPLRRPENLPPKGSPTHQGAVTALAASKDGKLASVADDGSVILWTLKNGLFESGAELTQESEPSQSVILLGHEREVSGATFSPDGSRIVTASKEGTARIWDAATGKEIAVLRGQEGSVNSSAFSPDGTRIVTASGGVVQIWDTARVRPLMSRTWSGVVNSAAFGSDGTRIVTALSDKTARICDAVTGKEITVLRGHNGPVYSAAFSPDRSRIVTASDDNTVRIWDAATGKEIAVLRGPNGSVYSAAFSPDGLRIVTASNDHTARIWDAATGKEIAVLRGHEDAVNSAAFSPDGSRIVTASADKTARIWDAATGKEIAVLRGHKDAVNSAAFSPDGSRIVTASADKTARIWDAVSGTLSAFSRDGKRVVTASADKTARRQPDDLRVTTAQCIRCSTVAFSPNDNRLITAGGSGLAQVWDANTGKALIILRHNAAINVARLSSDGTTAVTAGDDGAARLWDVKNGQQLAVIRGHGEAITVAEFTPDGSYLVTGARDGSVRVTSVALAELLNHADLIPVYKRYVSPATNAVSELIASLSEDLRWYVKTSPYKLAHVQVLSAQGERTLEPKASFKECSDCPEMIVIPAGQFSMGSPPDEASRYSNEWPQHVVNIAAPFAVAKFPVTFDEWDACVTHGDCDPQISDDGFGRGEHPAINVTWDDATQYVNWLAKLTGKPYRLLSEAEYEYVARAGTRTAYPWGNQVGKNNANCDGCGSEWPNKGAAPVGSFAPNNFGLFDVVGNVFQWVADCSHDDYEGAPTDGSAWTNGNCSNRMARSAAWLSSPQDVRSASRVSAPTSARSATLGFRIARTLASGNDRPVGNSSTQQRQTSEVPR